MEALPCEAIVTGEKKKTCRSLRLKERIALAATILERDGALFSETWMALWPELQRSGIRITSARRSPCAFIRTTRISIFHLRSLETGALIPAKLMFPGTVSWLLTVRPMQQNSIGSGMTTQIRRKYQSAEDVPFS